MIRVALLLILTVIMAGCVSTRNRHGYVIERGESELTATVGLDSKDSIIARYGEPSVRPPMDDDVWYYISTATNARAFYNADTTNRSIVAFKFDEEGKVMEIAQYSLEDGIPVNLVDRETPTRGKELTILEQLLGSVGQLPAVTGTEGNGP